MLKNYLRPQESLWLKIMHVMPPSSRIPSSLLLLSVLSCVPISPSFPKWKNSGAKAFLGVLRHQGALKALAENLIVFTVLWFYSWLLLKICPHSDFLFFFFFLRYILVKTMLKCRFLKKYLEIGFCGK